MHGHQSSLTANPAKRLQQKVFDLLRNCHGQNKAFDVFSLADPGSVSRAVASVCTKGFSCLKVRVMRKGPRVGRWGS